MPASLYPGINSLDLVISQPVDQYTGLVRDDLQITKVWCSSTDNFAPSTSTLVYSGPDLAITIPNLIADTTYYVRYALISELDISEVDEVNAFNIVDEPNIETFIVSDEISATVLPAATGTVLYYIKTTGPVIYKNSPNKDTAGDFTNITVYGKTSAAGVESDFGYLTVTGDTETEAATAVAGPVTTAINSSSTNTLYTIKLYNAANKSGGIVDTETVSVIFKGDSAISVELTNGSHPLPAESDGTGVVLTNSGTDIYVYEGGDLIPYNAAGYDSGNFNTWKVTKVDSVGIVSGNFSDQGEYARLSPLVSVSSTVTTATVTFTITGRTSSGVSFTTSKVQSFSVNREGASYDVIIESTNGDEFRVGLSTETILIAHVFLNGVEITDSIPSSRFKWRRASIIPQAYPNDDASWNTFYSSGYKQILVNVDAIYAKATFFCDLLGE